MKPTARKSSKAHRFYPHQRVPPNDGTAKFPLVFLPKSRRKAVVTALRKEQGPVVRELGATEEGSGGGGGSASGAWA